MLFILSGGKELRTFLPSLSFSVSSSSWADYVIRLRKFSDCINCRK